MNFDSLGGRFPNEAIKAWLAITPPGAMISTSKGFTELNAITFIASQPIDRHCAVLQTAILK